MARDPAAHHHRRGVQHRQHADDGRDRQDAEIGILRAMGMPAASIRRIFLAQGLLIGARRHRCSGSLLGVVAARGARPVQADHARPAGVLHRPPAGGAPAAGHRRSSVVGEPARSRRSRRLYPARAGVAAAPGGGDRANDACSRRAGLTKTYRGGDGGVIAVLDGVDLAVERGEMVAIVGASGAGKSTLLHLLGALDRPTRGEVLIGGQAVAALDDDAVSTLRNRTVGFVFQFHHLLREFTALENVMMPLRIGGMDGGDGARARALALLERVGLSGRVAPPPVSELSGGEQQRTAVARALAAEPRGAARRRAVGQPGPPQQRAAARPVRRAGARAGRSRWWS